ncbi:unnamed protein product [Cuscuta epithymum]|uniref:PB1 domain-containing protein n=2 Tax=Cuscuta epithymum TaxID=186058 RepID=A0AAV0F8G5_9ASTE|nr:unnamed protein product [Cuscuta epithymum]
MPEENVSVSESSPGSPDGKIKLLCSHGGRILPRPSDGQLKYVGGETRVISIARGIKLDELMKKLRYQQIEGQDVVLKYQVVPEDLDALVSVKTDEDVEYMIEECERHRTAGGSTRLRAFLFPSKPVVVLEQSPLRIISPEAAIEQLYIDAINGIIHRNNMVEGSKPSEESGKPNLALNSPQVFSISSACTSPKSPDDDIVSSSHSNNMMLNMGGFLNGGGGGMHKVQSMPSFGSSNLSGGGHHHHQQSGHYTPPLNESPRSPHYQQSSIMHHNNHFHGYQFGRPMVDPYRGPKPNMMGSVRSPGSPQYRNHYCYPTRQSQGGRMIGLSCNKCIMMPNDCYYERRAVRSASPSPIPLSPRYSSGHTMA